MTTPELFVVRLWDGWDGLWMDVCDPVSRDEAQRIWNEETQHGSCKSKFGDGDYYAIFPADTTMIFSYESGISQREGNFKERRD